MTFRLLSDLFLLAVMVQFFLAGLGIPQLGGDSIEAHRAFGYAAMELIPVLMFGAAIWARTGRTTIIMTFVLLVLVVVQPFLASESLDPQWLRSLHVLNALFIFALGFHITQRAGPMRMRSSET